MSTFERDELELGWWVAMHQSVETAYRLIRSTDLMVKWWRTF